MSDGTPSAPLAASPDAGTDAAASVSVDAAAPPAHRTTWASLHNPFALGFSLALGGLVAIALGVAFSNLSTIIIYIAFALFAALGLNPVVTWLENHSIRRGWAIVIVYLGFAIIMIAVLWLIVPTVVSQIAQFIRGIPTMISDFQTSEFYGWIDANLSEQVGGMLDEVQRFITDPANLAAVGGGVLRVGVTIATTISGLIIVLVLSLYFLASMKSMKESFVRFAPARSRAKVASMTSEITESVGAYLMGMVILAFFNSVVALILHISLGLPFPALMAVVAFCITLIPLIGSVLFWGVATVLALFTSPLSALIFAALYLVYMQLEAYVLTPKVMSKAIAVPGALVVIGAMVGGTLLGLLGALVAIPITASILLIVKQVVIPKQDAKV